MRRLKSGERLEELGLDRLDRQQGDQPDQRADLERDELAGVEMEHVVEELVLLVPQRHDLDADAIERAGDVQEVLEELRRDVLVHGVVARQLQRDRQHAERVEAHPGRAVRLADVAGDRERRGPVERRRCCRARGTRPGRRCGPRVSLRLTHQVKLRSSFWKIRAEEVAVRLAVHAPVDLVDAQGRPGVDRRVDVRERPLVRGQLAVGMLVPLAGQQQQLVLGEVRVDERHRAACGRPGPRRRTTGTPSRPASTGRRRVELAPVGVATGPPRPSGGGGPAGSPSSHFPTS